MFSFSFTVNMKVQAYAAYQMDNTGLHRILIFAANNKSCAQRPLKPIVISSPRADACSSSLFWKASVQAAQKFKYAPQRIDGVAVASYNVRKLFTYTLE